jgi:hypothetical protein
MGDFVKASLDIPLDNPSETQCGHMTTSAHCVVRTPIGSKPERVFMELNLKNGFQCHTYYLLDDLVPQAGNPKPAHFAIGLGDFYPP